MTLLKSMQLPEGLSTALRNLIRRTFDGVDQMPSPAYQPPPTIKTERVPVRREDIAITDFVSVFDLWNALRGDRLAPSWSEINLMVLPSRVIPHCIIVDCHPETESFTYRFCGTKIADLTQRELTGHDVLDVDPPDFGSYLFSQYKSVMTSKAPSLFVNQAAPTDRRDSEEAFLRLPLSSDGTNIDHILSVISLDKTRRLYESCLLTGPESYSAPQPHMDEAAARR